MNPIQLNYSEVVTGTWYRVKEYLPPSGMHILVSNGEGWCETTGHKDLASDYNTPVMWQVPVLPLKYVVEL
jgi:hypothetical protein